MDVIRARSMPIGAECWPRGGTHFRVWAPGKRTVQLVLDGRERLALQPEASGYWSLYVDAARPGARYHYTFDAEAAAHPDPASHFQPDGPNAGWCSHTGRTACSSSTVCCPAKAA